MNRAKPVYRKKLVEVALPLEAINAASAREKSIRHGHPSTLHLWWARRPLAACRAVLFAQLVDDPSAWPERFPAEGAQVAERKRLHDLIERLVPWEASNDERVLNEARFEIARSLAWGRGEEPPDQPKAVRQYLLDHAPPVYDPFCGGGSIPLEAQRLGLRAYGSDLNPVAVMISKALVEFPPRFAGLPPVNPEARQKLAKGGTWQAKGAQGLAEDVRYYGRWMRDEAEKRIGHLYPKVAITPEMAKDRPDLQGLVGQELTVIAWLWARTVQCRNPACRRHTPLLTSFVLSSKKGNERYLVPLTTSGRLRFKISRTPPSRSIGDPKLGLKRGMSGIFECIFCGTVTERDYVAAEGETGLLGHVQTAIVAKGVRNRLYLEPDHLPLPDQTPAANRAGLEADLAPNPRDVWCRNFGLKTPADLFTPRQLVAMTTFSDLVLEARAKSLDDAAAAGMDPDPVPLANGGNGALAYSDALCVYLALTVDRCADAWSSIATWSPQPKNELVVFAFRRHALPMTWDYAEVNPFSSSSGNFLGNLGMATKTLDFAESLSFCISEIVLSDATSAPYPTSVMISTGGLSL